MLDDPRTKARTFLESSSIVSELEDVLNLLIDEKPDDLHGFLANHFLHQSKQPQIASLILKRLTGPAGEPAVHIDLTVALRNRSQRYNGLTVNLSSGKLNAQTMKDYETFVNSPSLATIFNRVDLFDHTTIDELLANFRSEHVHEVPKVPKVTAPLEPESSTSEIIAEVSTLKLPATKQKPVVSPAVVVKTGGAPPPSQKRTTKEIQPIEVLPDEPEPSSFAGQLLITGISLACRLITAEIQQSNLYRLIQLPSVTNPAIPLPIIPILQSGPTYPGKQSIVKYYMLIPTPDVVHNEEWIFKLHSIIQNLRDSLTTAKGAILQAGYSTDDGCLVYSMDKPEQGLDILQNAVNTVCGTKEHWFDYGIQMGPYEAYDYTNGVYETMAGVTKSPDELADTYTEWINAYPRCIMIIDPFRHADKPALSRLCHRVSNRCYVTSTDTRRYQYNDDNDTTNCHLINLDNAPTVTELIQRVNTLRETHDYALGLFERDHHEVAQVHLADLAVGFGCRFLKLPGLLSLGGQTTSVILQRLSIIRDELQMNDSEQSARPKQHEFIHIRSTLDIPDLEMPPTSTNTKNKDKKKRP
ncbi:unnamed protein product [Adineta steineri]|uniref:phosphopyruvate hydratase n=1 Tax=Adineta steineri TaxID=433720 RepID=A0A814PVX4_9BILA|nr:unnamed protein product [Adineta steineri]CAF3570505.1 unnamed protein product [Adineta steineri]